MSARQAATAATPSLAGHRKLRRLPIPEALARLQQGAGAFKLPFDIRSISIRYYPKQQSGLRHFMEVYASPLVYMNPNTTFRVTRLGPIGSPRHLQKLQEQKNIADEAERVKASRVVEAGLQEFDADSVASGSEGAAATVKAEVPAVQAVGRRDGPEEIVVGYSGGSDQTIEYDGWPATEVLRRLYIAVRLPVPEELGGEAPPVAAPNPEGSDGDAAGVGETGSAEMESAAGEAATEAPSA